MAGTRRIKQDNAEYWRERFQLLEEAKHKKVVELMPQIERQYTRAVKAIEEKLEIFYSRYAEAAGITTTEARRFLTVDELKQHKMDVEEYIRLGEQCAEFFDPDIAHELELASLQYRTTRLEAMQLQLKAEAALFYARVEPLMWEAFADIYSSQYSRAAFEIFRGVGWQIDFSIPNVDEINLSLLTPWRADGLSFSDRIWGHCKNFEQDLADALIQGIMQGQSIPQMTRELMKTTQPGVDENALPESKEQAMKLMRDAAKNHKFNCERVIRTESAFFAEQAHSELYKRLGIPKYRYETELAEGVCHICKPLDLKVFDLKDEMVGTNAPPMHPFCRCIKVPYIDNSHIPGYVEQTRSGRDAKGKSVLFPATMNIYEWEQKYGSKTKKYTPPNMEQRRKHKL